MCAAPLRVSVHADCVFLPNMFVKFHQTIFFLEILVFVDATILQSWYLYSYNHVLLLRLSFDGLCMCQGGSELTILLYCVASFLSFFSFFSVNFSPNFHCKVLCNTPCYHALLFFFFFFSLQCWQLLQDNIFAILIMLKEHVNEGQISVPKKPLYRRAKP